MKNELTAKRLTIALKEANMRPQELADKSGVSKSSISQYINGSHAPSNVSSGKMGKILGVNPLWLMGFEAEKTSIGSNLTQKDHKSIETILDSTEELLKQDGLLFEGIPASREAIDSILSAMRVGMELAKKNNKEKYTPKKYKKD